MAKFLFSEFAALLEEKLSRRDWRLGFTRGHLSIAAKHARLLERIEEVANSKTLDVKRGPDVPDQLFDGYLEGQKHVKAHLRALLRDGALGL